MRNGMPHIHFYSTFEPAEPWRDALNRQLGDFHWTTGPACEEPASVDIALVSRPPPDGFGRFPALKAVLSLSAGVNYFQSAMLPSGVPLARSVDPSLTRHMVNYAKAAVFRYHRRFHVYEADTRARRWRFEAPLLPGDTPITVLGLGVLGTSIAQSLAAEGFPMHGWSASAKTLDGVDTWHGAASLGAAAAASNIIVNVLPLTDATRGILCMSLFRQMRRGSFLINMGRGAHVIEDDLVRALHEGVLGAATLDVASAEPLPPTHPLWSAPNILITPHVAGMTTPATAAVGVAENVLRALDGRPLLHFVDLERGY